MLQRRKFIKLLGGAAATWPLSVRAQQPALPVIGFLSSRSPVESTQLVAAFREGLKGNGFVEDKSVRIEYRWAEGQYDRLALLASDLVNRKVAAMLQSAIHRRRTPQKLQRRLSLSCSS